MLKDTPKEADTRNIEFVVTVVKNKLVWVIKNDGGWANWRSDEFRDSLIAPFWSDYESAARCAQTVFEGYKPESITLDSFLEDWLPELEQQGFWIGTNLTGEMTGIDVSPSDSSKVLMQAHS